jgi:hypothetical protein
MTNVAQQRIKKCQMFPIFVIVSFVSIANRCEKHPPTNAAHQIPLRSYILPLFSRRLFDHSFLGSRASKDTMNTGVPGS